MCRQSELFLSPFLVSPFSCSYFISHSWLASSFFFKKIFLTTNLQSLNGSKVENRDSVGSNEASS